MEVGSARQRFWVLLARCQKYQSFTKKRAEALFFWEVMEAAYLRYASMPMKRARSTAWRSIF